MYCDPAAKPWTSHSWVPKGHTSRHQATETAKAEELRGAGIRAETENLENVSDSVRSSAETKVMEPEREKKEEINPIPQTNRGKFNV